MQQTSRKLLTIISEAILERELISVMMSHGVSGYTIIDARGAGRRGVRTADWEHSANIRIEIVCDDSTADSITEHLTNHYYEKYGMIAYSSDVCVLRPEKF